jgi:uncharacterized protein (TIGR00369 family)
VTEFIAAPFANHVGAVIEEKREGYVRLSVLTGPEHADHLGFVHGGLLTTLMDSTIGIALGNLRAEADYRRAGPHATIDMSTGFYGQAVIGDAVIVEGRVVKIGMGAAFGQAQVSRAGDNEVLAVGHLTFAVPHHAQFRTLEG